MASACAAASELAGGVGAGARCDVTLTLTLLLLLLAAASVPGARSTAATGGNAARFLFLAAKIISMRKMTTLIGREGANL